MLSEKYKNFLKLNFYQIYPKSFMDGNNDGVGDFDGIIKMIPHLVDLGINAVWISPCFKSPNVDSGYDISNYFDVGNEFGTLDDFKCMLSEFHKHGIKVIVDLVVNHCSTEHFWFKEAIKGKDNPYHDYFYWFNKIPNDWKSCFGGSAYQYNEKLNEFYLHSFAVEQADLNWENPKVREEVKKIIDYWVDIGVDGFRCDVLDMISKDFDSGLNGNGPRLHEFINEIFGREKTKHLYTIGECWSTNESNLVSLTSSKRNELTTSFIGGNITHNDGRRFYLINSLDYDLIHRHFAKYQKISIKNDLVFAPFFENHDQCRSISRFANDKELRYESATFFATLLYTLYGTPFILQGEEFGTPDACYSTIKDFNDVETVNFYNANKNKIEECKLMHMVNHDSRDNGRHPIAWDSSINGGFNNGTKPWLSLHSRIDEVNLMKDKKSEKSVFSYYKKLIAYRKKSDVLLYGDFIDLTGNRTDLFTFERKLNDDSIIVVCNYNNKSSYSLPSGYKILFDNYSFDGHTLQPFEAIVFIKNV